MGKGLLEQGDVCQLCKKIHPKEKITSALLIEGLREVSLCPKCLNLCKTENAKDRIAIIRRIYGYSEEADRAIGQIPTLPKDTAKLFQKTLRDELMVPVLCIIIPVIALFFILALTIN